MERNGDNEKRRAHQLIDRLGPKEVSAVVGLLELIVDPVSRAIRNAPIDDEPVTAEEEQAVNQSRDWLKHNRPIAHEQVLAELCITKEEIERFMKLM
jgi:hypothetical protein